jgi:hypothetical protein
MYFQQNSLSTSHSLFLVYNHVKHLQILCRIFGRYNIQYECNNAPIFHIYKYLKYLDYSHTVSK